MWAVFTEGGGPSCAAGLPSERPPCECWGRVVELVPPTLLFSSSAELASAAEKPHSKEALLRERDTAAPFGPHEEPVRQRIHRMFLLRVKLMHFVNSLHNYIMTRVRVRLGASAPSPLAQVFTENPLQRGHRHKGAHNMLARCACEKSTYSKSDHDTTWQWGVF